jgi:hypothetical protein
MKSEWKMPMRVATGLLRCTGSLARSISVLTASLMLLAGPSWAQEGNLVTIEIIGIEHRSPSEIRNQLTPLLHERGYMGQIDNKLIIATTTANLDVLQQRIVTLDVPPRRLIVSVDFDYREADMTAVTDSIDQSSDTAMTPDPAPERVQAVEGEVLTFRSTGAVDDSVEGPETNPDAEPADVSENAQAQLLITAQIVEQQAHISVALENIDGFSGQHTLQIPLGQWFVMNPDAEGQPILALQVDVLP